MKAARSGASVVIADLEDSVSPDDKDQSREHVAGELRSGTRLAVRINGAGSPWHDQDVVMVAEHSCIVLLPKADSAAAVSVVAEAARSGVVVPIVESASGVLNVRELAQVEGVARLALGNADLSAQLGTGPDDRTALLTIRSMLVLASAEAGLSGPIDGVTLNVREPEAAADDARHALSLGFGGKLCIHPTQVSPVDLAFAPTEADVAWARRVLDTRDGLAGGVTVVDGAMVDRPVWLRATAILERQALRLRRT
jgi:citrate lyase subunit beta/citryl-CoA lyase